MKEGIHLIKTRKPISKDYNELLRWIGESLGLFSLRDKDSSCYRIFIELLKTSKINKALSSDEIAYRSHLSRGTVIHHINKLMGSGLVIKTNNKYQLKQGTLYHIIEEVEKDALRILDDIKKAAKEIDKRLFE